jgi:hypothetical protein
MYIRFNEPRQRERAERERTVLLPRTVKFRPREQNNKFILAVDGGRRRIRNAVSLAWILPARPSVSEQRISFHFPKAHRGHKFYVTRYNNRPKKEGGWIRAGERKWARGRLGERGGRVLER